MLDKLDRTTRLRLLRILAAAAWVDGEVEDRERAFVEKILTKLPIGEDERKTVRGYLDSPPHPAEVDPNKIPHEHREMLVGLVSDLVKADGKVDPEEEQALEDLKALLLA
ncbi:MAG TPA: TerB family tellurite resistance protein [Polyangiaceae bacterium]|nr:TerB family tellurite resistance protein [Polyangiaceae bacterium]